MNAVALIAQAKTGGWNLHPDNGQLRLRGRRPMPPHLLEEIRTHRDEIIALLNADERNEHAAIAQFDGGLPRAFAEGLAILSTSSAPVGVPKREWPKIVNNAALFAERWGKAVLDLGWSVRDVFGCDPKRPWARIDKAGLIWLIRDAKVVDVTVETAALRTPNGNNLTYYRRGQSGDALIWELIKS